MFSTKERLILILHFRSSRQAQCRGSIYISAHFPVTSFRVNWEGSGLAGFPFILRPLSVSYRLVTVIPVNSGRCNRSCSSLAL